jgi:hypothetical protein
MFNQLTEKARSCVAISTSHRNCLGTANAAAEKADSPRSKGLFFFNESADDRSTAAPEPDAFDAGSVELMGTAFQYAESYHKPI